MLRQFLVSILIFLSISIGNAEDNNLFIMDYPQTTTTEVPPVANKQAPPVIKQKPPVVREQTPTQVLNRNVPAVPDTSEESQFIPYDYWDLGKEEHLVSESKDSDVVTSEVKTSDVTTSVRPKPRPELPPKPTPKPTPPPKPAPKPAPPTTPPPKETTPKPAGGLKCDKPSNVAAACSQHGIREGLEKVISDCNTVRCYIRLFHMETSCRPFLTHKAIVTAYGMCSIEKDYNLRKRFGADCSKIDTVDNQIKCCRKMMKTVGKKYFEPVKVGRLPKCE